MLTLFVILSTIVFIFVIYFAFRYIAVMEFMLYLNDKGYILCKKRLANYSPDPIWEEEHEQMIKVWISITMVSYNRLLFSFKPLKPKNFLNEKQIEFFKKDI